MTKTLLFLTIVVAVSGCAHDPCKGKHVIIKYTDGSQICADNMSQIFPYQQ